MSQIYYFNLKVVVEATFTLINSIKIYNFLKNFSIFVLSTLDLIENISFSLVLTILLLVDKKNRKQVNFSGFFKQNAILDHFVYVYICMKYFLYSFSRAKMFAKFFFFK